MVAYQFALQSAPEQVEACLSSFMSALTADLALNALGVYFTPILVPEFTLYNTLVVLVHDQMTIGYISFTLSFGLVSWNRFLYVDVYLCIQFHAALLMPAFSSTVNKARLSHFGSVYILCFQNMFRY